jgi:hypothetical protein
MTSAVHDDTGGVEPRATRGFWLVLVLALLSFGAYFSHAAPTGLWKNQVFGTELWLENDPGGSYVASAHELFLSDQGPLFPGHPGTTLQLLLCALQHVYHWVAGDDGYSFTAFTARHIARVFFLSKMLVATLHALCVYFVYRLARALHQRKGAAVAAALGYATCLPFLYFLSRISVEPLLVLFFVTTFLSLVACHRRLEAGDSRGALVSAGLAGALAVSGSFSKLNLLGPLPFFGLAYLLARGGFGAAALVPLSRRLPSCLSFALTTLLAGLLYSQLVDWGDFEGLWRDNSGLRRLFHQWSFAALLPAATADGVFLLGELVFLALAAGGWIVLLRRPSPARPDFAWLSLYSCWILMLWAYRVATLGNLRPFHYLLPVMVLSAVSFGSVTHGMLARTRWSARGQWLALVAWVGLVHLGAIWSATDSRSRDAELYRPLREVHEVLGDLEPGQRIALLERAPGSAPVGRRLRYVHGLSDIHAQGGRESRLEAEFLEIFAPAPPGAVPEGTPIHRSSLLGSFAVIERDASRTDRR